VVDHVVEKSFEESRSAREFRGIWRPATTAHLWPGYVIEANVPAESIHQLAAPSPAVAGIACAGKPSVRPAMESAFCAVVLPVFSFTRRRIVYAPFFHVKA